MKKLLSLFCCVLLSVILMQCTTKDPDAHTVLAKNFQTPPPEARPWVYWFWLNGNISREGITADLEAMNRVGIGGVLIMEVDQGAPVGPVDFMSDQWRDLFKHMVSEANRLGIEVNMNNDAGWNGSGGPWVPLDKSMQVVVASEMNVKSGSKFQGNLPKPHSNSDFYRDIAVLAFPSTVDVDNPLYRIRDLSGKSMSTGGMSPGSQGAISENQIPAGAAIARKDVLNISALMDSTGMLNWDVPPIKGKPTGEWTIVRFGHTFTGAVNGPAPASGTGPECDKLSKEGVEANYQGMIAKLVQDNRPLVGKTFTATHVDSWEVGPQNWTPKMREEFETRRGYDMTPYMPVLTGRIVDSPEISERFLHDVRQTISDLLAANYIGHLRELANKDGLRLTMEAYSTPANDMDVGNYIQEPIAEFWWPGGGGFYWTLKSMSSLAHVNGHNIVGAEAFTADDGERWLAHPALIKALGDKAFCEGINRYIVHRYAMQPWVEDRRPGMTMGPWGLHYERTQTWWEDSKAWHEYVSRCQFMLRQGTFVADVLSLQSEEPLQRFRTLKLAGYDYDGISAEAFLKDVTVAENQLVVPSGMKYRLLVLPDASEMSPLMLEKITALVEAGATVTGTPPLKAFGLSGYPESDERVKFLAENLWGKKMETDHVVGPGHVWTGKSPDEVLAGMGIKPDFISSRSLNFIHRKLADMDVYFIASADPNPVDAICSFRVKGMNPEVWHPESGLIEPVTLFEESDGTTRIPLRFEPSGSMFVVFRKGTVKGSDHIVSIKRDGAELVDMTLKIAIPAKAEKAADVTGSFTMSAWVKPDIDIPLPIQTNVGVTALSGERNDVVYAAPGHEVWTDNDAGAGFGVGTNGIGIYEHSSNYFPALLVHPAVITAWTHVAVVYQDNTPSLWINGKLAAKGLKSSKIVHGSVGVTHTRTVKPFSGQFTALIQFPKALSAEEILKLSGTLPDTSVVKIPEPAFDLLSHEFIRNGEYEIKTADGFLNTLNIASIPDKQPINGPWNVQFEPGWGAPDNVAFKTLVSWSRFPDDGVRYFSGSATYHNSFDYTPASTNSHEMSPSVYLDLGKVAVMAEVTINGKNLGLLWKPPYRIDITDAVIPGTNDLQIRVVNLMINRMIGDESLPEDSDRKANGTLNKWPQWLLDGKPSPTGRFTFSSWRLWNKNSTLQVSGLLGPVIVQTTFKYTGVKK